MALIPPVPAAVVAAPLQEAVTPSVAPPVLALPTRVTADPRLIAELKKPLPFENLPAFKALLEGTAALLDAIRDADGCTALHWAARG